MKVKKIEINKLKPNPKNPRTINKSKFERLKKSLSEFPKMLELRPIVVDENFVVLGGNMRLKALRELGIKEAFYIQEKELTEEQKNQFIIKDNASFGDWDWDILANEWETKELKEWGIDVWQPEKDLDYSVLEEVDVDDEMQTMYEQTKKSIILEYPADSFDEIKQLYENLKSQEIDLPKLFVDAMKVKYEIK
tara:strand:- start:1448 stop:2026 length:579 start_codon:yes stop_codon:yes gene_type:complete